MLTDEKNPVTEEEDDEVIVLQGPDGEEVEFEEIADITLGEHFYVILQPVERPEDMGQDEAVVFEVVSGEENDEFVVVDDDDIIDEVFTEYNRLFEEQQVFVLSDNAPKSGNINNAIILSSDIITPESV